MVTLTLNEPVAAFDEAANVMVAEVDAPAAKFVTVGTHEIVRYVFAVPGLQLLVLRARVSAVLPVFLM